MSVYQEKIKQAILFIHNNLSSDLNWKSISKECGISEFHFHRIFTAYMNESPREYIIRQRLERAISLLCYGNNDISLSEVAFESGYSNQSNFTKAFKSYFGVSPTDVKKGVSPKNSKIGKIKSKYGKEFKVEDLYPVSRTTNGSKTKDLIMNVEIKEIKARTVLYSSSARGYVKKSIFETWRKMMEGIASLGNDMNSLTTFGIGHDNPQVTPEEKCRYDACVLKSDLNVSPKSLKEQVIPAGKFACFYYKGESQGLLDFYLNIYANWFVENGYEPGNFPLIEKYIQVDKDNPEGQIELETQFLLK